MLASGAVERGKGLLKVGLTATSWLVTGGGTLLIAVVGILRRWPPLVIALLCMAVFMFVLAGFLAFKQKALAEQRADGKAGFSVTAIVQKATPTVTKYMIRAMFDVEPGPGLVKVPHPPRAIRFLDVKQPRESVRAEDLPVRVRLGWVWIWPQDVWLKEFTPEGLLVEGIRSRGRNIDVEIWMDVEE